MRRLATMFITYTLLLAFGASAFAVEEAAEAAGTTPQQGLSYFALIIGVVAILLITFFVSSQASDES